jgi:hypothetical protein
VKEEVLTITVVVEIHAVVMVVETAVVEQPWWWKQRILIFFLAIKKVSMKIDTFCWIVETHCSASTKQFVLQISNQPVANLTRFISL